MIHYGFRQTASVVAYPITPLNPDGQKLNVECICDENQTKHFIECL